MNTFKITLSISVFISLTACSTLGKKSPAELVFDSRLSKDNNPALTAMQSGKYSKPEIQQIAQEAINQHACSLAYDITDKYQLNPNLKSEYQTLFQCLIFNKQYDSALSILKKGASPTFIKEARFDRNNAIEEVSAWGALDIVKELLSIGEKPTSKAFYLGISGHYHANYEKALQFIDLFRPFISNLNLNYEFNERPLLFEVATERKFNMDQRFTLSKILLDNGANPNVGVEKTVYGSMRNVRYEETAYAAVRGTPRLTLLFLTYGANPKSAKAYDHAMFIANLKPGIEIAQGLVIEIKGNLILLQEANDLRWMPLAEASQK